jgi:predicted transcriptional regulator
MTNTSSRDTILRFVLRYPGVHEREIERRLSLSSKLATYHLDALEHEGLVTRVREAGFTRFVPTSGRKEDETEFVCLMRRSVALHITILLLDEPEMAQGEIARRLKLAKASVSYHLAPLTRSGVLASRRDGRETHYKVSDKRAVRARLRGFTPLPGELGAFTRIWTDVIGPPK